MFFLNFSLGQFFALLGMVGLAVTALYLFDRRGRTVVVSTLRFWDEAGVLPRRTKERRLHDPYSFLLQLLAVLLLLMALGQLQWGTRPLAPRNHVLLLDASSASAIQVNGQRTLDRSKAAAQSFLENLPSQDRVMLVRLDGLLTPLTAWTTNREEVSTAVRQVTPGGTAMDMKRALVLADGFRNNGPGKAGEVVYVGPAQGSEESNRDRSASIPNLRLLRGSPMTGSDAAIGISKLALQSQGSGGERILAATIRNYAPEPRDVLLQAKLGDKNWLPRHLSLPGGGTSQVEFPLPSQAAGLFRLRLAPHDAFAANDTASLAVLPAQSSTLTIYTNRQKLWAPYLPEKARLNVRFASPASYDAHEASAACLFDSFVPSKLPRGRIVIVNPLVSQSLLPVRTTVHGRAMQMTGSTASDQDNIQEGNTLLSSALVFRSTSSDTILASVAEGPIALEQARDNGKTKLTVVGFDPLAAPFRFSLQSPIFFAKLLRLVAPAVFKDDAEQVTQLGLVRIPLIGAEEPDTINLQTDEGQPVIKTVRDGAIEFYASQPQTVHLQTPERDIRLHAELPEFAPVRWVPLEASYGNPRAAARIPQVVDLWKILALAAALLLAIDWYLFAKRRTRWGLILQCFTAAAIVLALVVPPLWLESTKVATLAAVDVSGSISQQDLGAARDFLKQAQRTAGPNQLHLWTFAKHLHPASAPNPLNDLTRETGEEAAGTNIESALTALPAAVPPYLLPRAILFSDGSENEGSVVRGIAQLQRLQIPVDVKPMGEHAERQITLRDSHAVRESYAGAPLEIDLEIGSPAETPAALRLSAGEKPLAEEKIALHAGRNSVRVHARINNSETTGLTMEIDAGRYGRTTLTRALHLTRPRLLFVSGDPSDADRNLLETLKNAKFEVVAGHPDLDDKLDNIQVVVLNNLNFEAIPEGTKSKLEAWVERGGGLLSIGGEKQVYKEGRTKDSLDAILPAELAPPQTPEGVSVALIVDKSSSMEGRKIELARASASGVVDHLRPTDTIAVLMFDNSYQWAVTMRKASDKSHIKQLISGITPDGGTQIAPALAEAYRQIVTSEGSSRHIVLLTDGISEEGDSIDLAHEAALHQVTISTVGLGQDVNRTYLERIASTSGGRSYFLNQPQGLEQILLDDVRNFSGQTAVEKPYRPLVEERGELLRGLDMSAAPALKGYTRYKAKDGSETLLGINPDKKDPLYVRWQYGLGRTAVFTSDAKARWAKGWIGWPGFDRFWINVARDLVGENRSVNASAVLNHASGRMEVHYDFAPDVPVPTRAPEMVLLDEAGHTRTFELGTTSGRSFNGVVDVGALTGLLRVRPIVDGGSFGEIGIFRSRPEFDQSGPNTSLLHQLASATGGRYNPAPAQIFDASGRSSGRRWEIWPLFLMAALLLNLGELALRKKGAFAGAGRTALRKPGRNERLAA